MTLAQFIAENGLNRVTIMDALQENAVVSDNCIWPEDVGNDAEALAWLQEHQPMLTYNPRA